MTGRPREFDRDDALERAMDVFWRKGYEATSVHDLLEAIGINRGSLYAAFVDKATLFREALEHYGRSTIDSFELALDAPGSPLANVRGLLTTLGRRASDPSRDGSCRGCLVTNTAIERSPHDPRVAVIVRAVLHRIEQAFRRTLERAVEARELPARTDTRALARFLLATAQGMIVLGKAGTSRAAARDVTHVALSVFD